VSSPIHLSASSRAPGVHRVQALAERDYLAAPDDDRMRRVTGSSAPKSDLPAAPSAFRTRRQPSQPIPVSLGGDDVELPTPNAWFGMIVDARSAMNAFLLMDRLPPKNLRN